MPPTTPIRSWFRINGTPAKSKYHIELLLVIQALGSQFPELYGAILVLGLDDHPGGNVGAHHPTLGHGFDPLGDMPWAAGDIEHIVVLAGRVMSANGIRNWS